ncbi:Pycsar system effector family protein [Streptomyces lateritius]|uniref:Pycsar system effector family protein n=1 Tax=Streptomyces lateritius TaxID=67313 RepID=A0ABW6YLC4_9ACTN
MQRLEGQEPPLREPDRVRCTGPALGGHPADPDRRPARNPRRRPRLRASKKLEAECAENFIFFGHPKYWEPTALAQKLQEQDMLPVLTNQLVNMSKIAWKKHRYVQLSFLLAGIGGILVFIAGAIA